MTATVTPSASSDSYTGPDPDITRLYDNVQALVTGVGLELVQMMAWNAIQQFYRDSTSRREVVFWQLAIGASEVNFDPFDNDWRVAWILGYTGLIHGRVIPPGRLRDLVFPTTARSGSALLALMPASLDVSLQHILWTHWFDTILAGTRFFLHREPNKPFSDPGLAQFFGLQFRRGIAEARSIAQAGYTSGPGPWAYPYFAHGRRKN